MVLLNEHRVQVNGDGDGGVCFAELNVIIFECFLLYRMLYVYYILDLNPLQTEHPMKYQRPSQVQDRVKRRVKIETENHEVLFEAKPLLLVKLSENKQKQKQKTPCKRFEETRGRE